MLDGSTWIDPGQHKIKVIIIIVLKFDSIVNLGQDSGHESRELTRINVRIKIAIIINLKIRLGSRQKQGLGHGSRGSTQVDLS